MKKTYEKPFARNLGENPETSFGQIICAAGSTDTGICSNGDNAGGGCSNGNQNITGLGCTNGSNNAGAPGYNCLNGNNNETCGCNSGNSETGCP
jgi:hypothetical protein